jgi:hypothetical protein
MAISAFQMRKLSPNVHFECFFCIRNRETSTLPALPYMLYTLALFRGRFWVIYIQPAEEKNLPCADAWQSTLQGFSVATKFLQGLKPCTIKKKRAFREAKCGSAHLKNAP